MAHSIPSVVVRDGLPMNLTRTATAPREVDRPSLLARNCSLQPRGPLGREAAGDHSAVLEIVNAKYNKTPPVITSPTWDSGAVGLLHRSPLNEAGARVQQLKVIGNGRIIRLTFIGLEEFPTRVHQVAT
jgi:hypothetical protein